MINNEKKQAPRCPWCGAEMQHITLELAYRSDKPLYHFYECGRASCRCTSPERLTEEAAYKAATKRASRWISVEDALPAEKMHVIGFDIESRWNYPLLYFCPDTKEFLDEAYYYKPVSITHWMPYPEAPKEDEDD
jgi:hypothetical protein